MDWYMIAVGVVGFAAGMATAVMLAALAVAGRHEQRMGQHSTHSTQNTHTDTQSR